MISEPTSGKQVKRLLYALAVIVLAMLYLKLIYLSDTIDAARRSAVGQKIYLVLANVFRASNADQGETLLLGVYALLALVAAVITVYLLSRLIVRPMLARQH